MAQAPPPEPPPRVEASAQFTLLKTNGNATAIIYRGVEVRPAAPWAGINSVLSFEMAHIIR